MSYGKRLKLIGEQEIEMPDPQEVSPLPIQPPPSGLGMLSPLPPPHPPTLDFRPVLSAITLGIRVLNARMLLLLALLGAFALAWTAVGEPSTLRILADALYNICVLLPIVWLAATKG